MEKQCKLCKKILSIDDFHKDSREKDGHVIICKECAKAKTRAWSTANAVKKQASDKRYYAENAQGILQKSSQWKKNNRERVNELARRSYASNAQENRRRNQAKMHTWRANPANKTHEQERRAKQAQLHPGKKAESLRVWRLKNPELAKAQIDKRRALRRGATESTLTAKEWAFIRQCYEYRCAYCRKKQQRLTQDHITPLSQGGSHTASNIVPACQSCNSKKHTGPPPKPVQPILPLGI